MTMRRNTRRLVTPRKTRLWTQQSGDLTIAAAAVNQASQQALDLSGQFVAQSGRQVTQGVTLARVFINGFVHEAVATTPTVLTVALAVQMGAVGLDNGDFPELATRQGRPQLSWSSRLLEPTAASISSVMEPNEQATLKLESRSQRTAPGHGQQWNLVVEKDGASENDVIVSVSVTCLWLFT